MGVTTQHPLYTAYLHRWKRSEDFFDGEDAVKAAKTKYLKKTSQHIAIEKSATPADSENAYSAYLDRAELPDIYQSSIIGLSGLACHKKWTIEIPPAMRYLEENASSGIPLEALQGRLIQSGLKTGRLGHFVDNDPVDNRIRIALYHARSVINWKDDFNLVRLVVLQESHQTPELTDIFSHEQEAHYRVLRLGEEIRGEIEGQYIVEVYRTQGDQTEFTVAETFPMDFQEGVIPFTFQGSTGLESDPDMIPLEGMLLQCRKYYQLSADLYHDIQMSNTSTLFGKGISKDDISFAGAGAAVITDNDLADLKFVSTDGNGQDNAIAMMDRKLAAAEKQSHRMTDVSGGVEASSTLRQKIMTKTATLRSVEQQAVMALQTDLRYIAVMMGLDPMACNVTSEYDYTDEQVDAVLFGAISEAIGNGTAPEEWLYEYARDSKLTEMEDEEIKESLELRREERQELEAAATVLPVDDDDEEEVAA